MPALRSMTAIATLPLRRAPPRRSRRPRSAAPPRWRCTTSWRWRPSRAWYRSSTTAATTTWTRTPSCAACSRCAATSCGSPSAGARRRGLRDAGALRHRRRSAHAGAPPAASTRIAARSSCSACCAPRPAPCARDGGAAATPRTLRARAAPRTGATRWPRAAARVSTLPGGIAARATGPARRVGGGGAGLPGAVRDGVPALRERACRGLAPRCARLRRPVPRDGRAGRHQPRPSRRPRRTAPRAGARARASSTRRRRAADGARAGRRPSHATSSPGACRPAARPTCWPRRAGSCASGCDARMSFALLFSGPGHAASRDAALAGRRRTRARDARARSACDDWRRASPTRPGRRTTRNAQTLLTGLALAAWAQLAPLAAGACGGRRLQRRRARGLRGGGRLDAGRGDRTGAGAPR